MHRINGAQKSFLFICFTTFVLYKVALFRFVCRRFREMKRGIIGVREFCYFVLLCYKTSIQCIKYSKGACEDCGALTLKKKDCLEVWNIVNISFVETLRRIYVIAKFFIQKLWSSLFIINVSAKLWNDKFTRFPQNWTGIQNLFQRLRRVGAKFTGEDIKPNEYLPQEVNFDYDGKRDRCSTRVPHCIEGYLEKKRCTPVAFSVRRCRSKGGCLLFIEIDMILLDVSKVGGL